MEESGMSEGEKVRFEAIIKDHKLMTLVEEDESPSYEKIVEEVTKCQILSLTNTTKIQDTLVQAIDKITPGSQAQVGYMPKTMIEIEIQKAVIKKQQFIKEKELTEEILRAKERILEAEMKLALSKLDGQCDLSFGHDICAPIIPENRVNVYSNASAPPGISLDPTLIQSPTNNMPSEISPNFGAVGLDQLALLECVKITQASYSGVNETHHVVAPDGSVVFRADITLGWIVQAFVRRRPGHRGELFDTRNDEVVTFRPLKSRKMKVQVGKEKACILRLKSTLLKPVVSVKDMFGNVLLKIKGQVVYDEKTAVFAIETVNKLRIGCIHKDLLYDASGNFGNTYIQFPRDLDITCKAAIIICSFLIMSKAQAQMRERRMQQALLATLQEIKDK